MLVRQKGKHHHIQAMQAEQAAEQNPFKGKRIYIHSTSFKIGVEEAVKALDGPPAWSVRLKRIEEWAEHTAARARRAWAEMAVAHRDEKTEFALAWKRYVKSVDFGEVNTWIDRHNEYFPIEANLPCDIRTGKLMWGGKPFEKMGYFTPQWLLESFPPRLDRALECARSMGVEDKGTNSERTDWA